MISYYLSRCGYGEIIGTRIKRVSRDSKQQTDQNEKAGQMRQLQAAV